MLFNKKTNVIGVNISNRSIEMVELSGSSKENAKLSNYAITFLDEGIVKDGHVADIAQCVQQIQYTWKKLKTKNKNIAVSISMDDILVKEDSFATIYDDNETLLQVENSIGKTLTSEIDDLYIDYAIFDKNTDFKQVYITAAKRDFINAYVNIFEQAGLNVTIVDVHGHVTDRVIQHLNKVSNTVNALVYFSKNESLLQIVFQGEVIFERALDHNIKSIISQIGYDKNVDFSEATSLLFNMSEDIKSNYWVPFLDGISLDIRRALQFFSHSDKPLRAPDDVSNIYFLGYEAHLPDLTTFVSEKINKSVSIMNPLLLNGPLEKIDQQQLLRDASLLVQPFGLALRSFESDYTFDLNLLPWRQTIRELEKKQFINILGVTALTAVGLTYGHYVLLDNQLESIKNQNTEIDQAIERRQKEITLIDQIKSDKKLLLQRQKVVENLQKNKYDFVRLINFISSKTTPDIRLKEIQKDIQNQKKTIRISGVTTNNAIIAEYVVRLSDPNIFDDVRIVSINKITLPNSLPGNDFILEASFDDNKEIKDTKDNIQDKTPNIKEQSGGMINDAKKILDNAKKIKGASSEASGGV